MKCKIKDIFSKLVKNLYNEYPNDKNDKSESDK